MFQKFMRKYGLILILAMVIAVPFAIGFFVGKAQSKKIPVFIEVRVPVVEESPCESEEIAEPAQEETKQEVEQEKVELVATAYCACEKCCGVWATKRPLDSNGNPIVYTASGTVAKANHTIAVDPSVFPYGTVLEIDGIEYVAEDCGGAIKGNRIDVYFDSHQAAREYGRQNVVAIVKGAEGV